MKIFLLFKKEIIVLSIAIIFSALIVSTSLYFFDEKEAENNISWQQLQKARKKYHDAMEKRKLLQQYEPEYKRLQQKSLVGDENRLAWLNRIDFIVQRYGLPEVKYHIGPQQRINNPALAAYYPQIGLYRSKMKLEMNLLHEGDLISFMDQLQKTSSGVFDAYSCQLKKRFIDFNEVIKSRQSKNIEARCQLGWISIKEHLNNT